MSQKPVPTSPDNWTQLEQALLPVLAEAAIGHFDRNLELDAANSRPVNEILAGVQVLLEVIRQQQAELDVIHHQLEDARQRTSEILSEVLDRPMPKFKG